MAEVSVAERLDRYQEYFTRTEQQYELPKGLLRAIAEVESGGRPEAVSDKGAGGLMQFMPMTGAQYGLSFRDRFNPVLSIDAAGRLLQDLLETFGGDVDLAIRGYHAGEAGVRARGRAYEQSTGYSRRVRIARGGEGAVPVTARSFERNQAVEAARARREEAREEAQGGGVPWPAAGVWWPGNWEGLIRQAGEAATPAVVLLVAGVLALWIGVRNA